MILSNIQNIICLLAKKLGILFIDNQSVTFILVAGNWRWDLPLHHKDSIIQVWASLNSSTQINSYFWIQIVDICLSFFNMIKKTIYFVLLSTKSVIKVSYKVFLIVTSSNFLPQQKTTLMLIPDLPLQLNKQNKCYNMVQSLNYLSFH